MLIIDSLILCSRLSHNPVYPAARRPARICVWILWLGESYYRSSRTGYPVHGSDMCSIGQYPLRGIDDGRETEDGCLPRQQRVDGKAQLVLAFGKYDMR